MIFNRPGYPSICDDNDMDMRNNEDDRNDKRDNDEGFDEYYHPPLKNPVLEKMVGKMNKVQKQGLLLNANRFAIDIGKKIITHDVGTRPCCERNCLRKEFCKK